MPASKSRKVKRPDAAATRRKVVVDFPRDLFRQAERAASELAVNRSNFIRAAVEHYIGEMGRKRLERELIEGYTANAELSRRINEEFSHVDAEIY
jgi:metal-responsive CopG/Arc/MetJ family transcriptional regulator